MKCPKSLTHDVSRTNDKPGKAVVENIYDKINIDDGLFDAYFHKTDPLRTYITMEMSFHINSPR